MKINILTLFPEMFGAVLSAGVIGRAAERGLLEFHVTDIRDHTEDKHRKADDYPFGGGAGQLMTAQPIFSALRSIGYRATEPVFTPQRDASQGDGPSSQGDGPFVTMSQGDGPSSQGDGPFVTICGDSSSTLIVTKGPSPCDDYSVRMLYLSPRGRLLYKELAEELSKETELVLLCGHYEGVDQRALDAFGFEEVSIGDYILTGGELPAMVLIDTVCRLIPGVLGSEESHAEESVYSGLLEYSQYTRPASFEGLDVPNVLVSGDHEKIAMWKFTQSLSLTAQLRPEMLRTWLASNYDGLDKKRKAIAAHYLEE